MHDQAEMARPNLLRNGDLQHRCNDQIRRLAGDGGDHRLVIRCDANADVVATLPELDPQTLAEAVMGRRQKENSHNLSPCSSAGRRKPEPAFPWLGPWTRRKERRFDRFLSQSPLLRAPRSGARRRPSIACHFALRALLWRDPWWFLLQWRNHLGGTPPAHLPSWLLTRVLAYRLQAAAFGDLEPGLLRRLKNAGDAATKIEPAPFANPAARHARWRRPQAG